MDMDECGHGMIFLWVRNRESLAVRDLCMCEDDQTQVGLRYCDWKVYRWIFFAELNLHRYVKVNLLKPTKIVMFSIKLVIGS
jgi:hypothetical protein